MREIKFRAWNKVVGVMVDNAIRIRDLGVFAPTMHERDIVARADKYEIMQYTGLKDKNGKEIYEGDIVRSQQWYHNPNAPEYPSDPNPNNEPATVTVNEIHVIAFRAGCFVYEDTYNPESAIKDPDEQVDYYSTPVAEHLGLMQGREDETLPEVIGNIWENPALHESEEQERLAG